MKCAAILYEIDVSTNNVNFFKVVRGKIGMSVKHGKLFRSVAFNIFQCSDP